MTLIVSSKYKDKGQALKALFALNTVQTWRSQEVPHPLLKEFPLCSWG